MFIYFKIIFMYVDLCMSPWGLCTGYSSGHAHGNQKRALILWSWTRDCELPDMSVRNRISILCKRSIHSYLLSSSP